MTRYHTPGGRRRHPVRLRRVAAVVLALVGVSGLGGCANYPPPPSTLEKEYGTAVEYNKAAMILVPSPTRATDPVTGLSPTAAQHEGEAYNKTFAPKKDGKPSSVTLGVTGGAFGGGGEGGGGQ